MKHKSQVVDISFVQWMPDSQQVSIRDSMEHTFLGLTSDEANCLADGAAVSVASASHAELMQERRQRQRAQAEAGNAEANEIAKPSVPADRESSLRTRPRLATSMRSSDAGRSGSGSRRVCLEARPTRGASAGNVSVAERAVNGSSAVIRDAAEAQRESARERGRQRRGAGGGTLRCRV